MKTKLLALATTGLLVVCMQAAYADSANYVASTARDFAMNPNLDIKAAQHYLAQNPLGLGHSYAQNYGVQLKTSAECLEEVAQLGIDANTFTQNALAHQYKTIAVVDGNIVMLVASGASLLTYTVLDQGNYCNIEKSTNDAYWAAYVFRMGMSAIDVAFKA